MKGIYAITEEAPHFLRLQVIGQLSVQAVETLCLELERYVKRADEDLQVLIDLSYTAAPAPVLVHGTLVRLLRRYRTPRVAIFGGPSHIMQTTSTLLKIARAADHVRLFHDEGDACNWLANGHHAPATRLTASR